MAIEALESLSLANTAALLKDASRATMLLALLDGRAYTASELARSANVSPPAASFHLKRLMAAKFLRCVTRGRYRYFRLAGPEVAHALEGMLALNHCIAPGHIASTCPESLRNARVCYNHLAGRVGVALYRALTSKEWLIFDGPRLVPAAGAKGFLGALGLACNSLNMPATACLDWSERQFHLAGPLGVSMLSAMIERRWLLRTRNRALVLTAKGRLKLAEHEIRA